MAQQSDALLKLILDSKALSIWNSKTGPVFWYAASVPGPFYLNTEIMIGRALSEKLLEEITAIVAATTDNAKRAAQLETLIMNAYRQNDDFKTVIRTMIEKAKEEFPDGTFGAISGGERRDWLFSIPVAIELGVPHAYLFKNRSIYCASKLPASEKVLHVSDLINNAASYFDMWLPVLKESGFTCPGTLTVNTRGSAGVNRLEEAGYKVAALNRIDLPFFETCRAKGLISSETLEEITAYFSSPKEWASRYLMSKDALFAIPNTDAKSAERMASFFSKDPWNLRASYPDFFARMTAMVEKQQAPRATSAGHL